MIMMMMTTMTMTMTMMIVSVEQRLGWTEHVRYTILPTLD